MQSTQILALSEIAAERSDNWITTHCDGALVRNIRRMLSPDVLSIFQLEHDLGAGKKVARR
jgi:hypothetical protein